MATQSAVFVFQGQNVEMLSNSLVSTAGWNIQSLHLPAGCQLLMESFKSLVWLNLLSVSWHNGWEPASVEDQRQQIRRSSVKWMCWWIHNRFDLELNTEHWGSGALRWKIVSTSLLLNNSSHVRCTAGCEKHRLERLLETQQRQNTSEKIDFKATKAHLFLLLPDYHDFFRKFLKPQSGDNILFAGEDKGYFFLHEKTIYLFQLVFLLNNSQNIK